MKKFIKITNRCYVTTSRGRVRGPILTPFKEDVSIIYIMIVRDGAEVYEVCPNGRTVKLTTENFDKDNSGMSNNTVKLKSVFDTPNNISASARSVTIQTEKSVETTTVETEQPTIVEDTTTQKTESDTETTVVNQTNSNKKNKRK